MTSNRRIVVMGSKGTGKTTFSVSASQFAGDRITGEVRQCTDTLVIQGDSEGVMGATDAGLIPSYVLDMTHTKTWAAYEQLVVKGLTELKPKLDDGTIKVIVIDLAYPARLIEDEIAPKDPAGWSRVKAKGSSLYRALAGLKGVTVVANCQVKASAPLIPNQSAEHAAEARAIGGEVSQLTMALTNGIAELWRDNASFILTRESRRGKAGLNGTEGPATYWTFTQSTKKYQAASRAKSILPAKMEGDITLRAILNKVYGDAI
jgi:hypothetical protein